MNNSEKQIKKKLEAEGWKVLRGGAPDFIALKVDNGNIIGFKGVEVKPKNGKLTYEQGIYKTIFEKAGIPYEVVLNPSTHSKPSHPNPGQPNPVLPISAQANPNSI